MWSVVGIRSYFLLFFFPKSDFLILYEKQHRLDLGHHYETDTISAARLLGGRTLCAAKPLSAP